MRRYFYASFGQQRFGCVAACTGLLERDERIRAKRKRFLLASKSIGETPELAARRRHEQTKAAAIRQLDRPSASLDVTDRCVVEHVGIEGRYQQKYQQILRSPRNQGEWLRSKLCEKRLILLALLHFGELVRTNANDDVVPLAGLEPARCFHHLILSQARLPIPPQGH